MLAIDGTPQTRLRLFTSVRPATSHQLRASLQPAERELQSILDMVVTDWHFNKKLYLHMQMAQNPENYYEIRSSKF
jgi:hypothetical protein